jgi:hypothetical protein
MVQSNTKKKELDKRINLRKNQQGASLILVLLCMTFLGILATILLTATMSNLRMKLVDAKSKSNFYTAESAVDELKIGLEELSENSLKQAYAYMLQRYSVTPESERANLLLRKFVNVLYGELADDSKLNQSKLKAEEVISRYLISNAMQEVSFIKSEEIRVIRDYSDYSVTLKGISLRYVNGEGYESTITTDLKITSTYPTRLIGAVNYNGIYYTDYGLIADGLLKKEESGEAKISGSVYAGAGIVVKNSEAVLSLQSNRIISRGNIEVQDRGKMIVKPMYGEGGVLNNSVWARNLATNNEENYSSSSYESTTYFDLSANIYISDDLTLNARKGDVVLKGTYFGFHTNNSTIEKPIGTPEGSSSISVNASEASLDMKEVSKLWIAGKSYLSIPNTYGFTSDGGKNTPVLSGESISFKGNQIAYLVPGNCIIGIGHNPMTEKEYENLKFNKDGYGVDIKKNGESGGIFLEDYIDFGTPYQSVVVQYQNSSGVTHHMVYLYLNFRSSNAASDYFVKYLQVNQTKLENLAASMKLGTMRFKKDGEFLGIRNTGNVLSYEHGILSNKSRSDELGQQIDSRDEYLEGYEDIYSGKYNGLISCLDENNNSVTVPNSLAERLIYYKSEEGKGIEGIEAMAIRLGTDKVYEKEIAGVGSETEYILVTNSSSETVISNNDRKGVIIATGDVKIQNGAFSGMIITKGNIILGQGGHVNAMPEYSKSLIEQDEKLRYFFRDYISEDGTEGTFGKTIRIEFRNWKKE